MDWSRFPCALGDVVVRASDATEAWLGGAVVLSEDAPVAVLFVCPEAGGDRAVYARARPEPALAWLLPVAAGSLVTGREPPTAVEIDGARFDRTRRLPLRVALFGAHVPDIGPTAIVAEYEGPPGELALVLVGALATLAYRGSRLAPHEYDVWRAGEPRAPGKRS